MELIRLTRTQRLVRATFILLVLAFTLLPVAWIVSIALRPAAATEFPISLIPPSLTLDNVHEVLFGASGLGTTPYLNAAIYGLSSAVVTAVASMLGGYALARYDVRAGETLLIVVLALSFLPTASRIVPLFILFSRSGLYGSSYAMILAYAAGSTALGIWLMAGTIRQIPVRLEQAARIDGAGWFLTLRRILIPLATPGLLVVATLAFIDGWNAFSLPLILIPKESAQPYTVALQKYIQEIGQGINWPLLAAASLVALVPVLTVFAFLQRRLVRGGGLTGAIGVEDARAAGPRGARRVELRIEGLTVEYGKTVAVHALDLTVADGELVALVGPSGCGKSTTLGFIAGFIGGQAGRVMFDGRDVTKVSPQKRGIGYVFQDYAIYPHLTVRENIRFPLDASRTERKKAEADVEEVASLVGVGELLGRRPHQLSGGQRQRVALARALVKKPVVLLLDEPLSNLDAHLRVEVRAEIRRLQLTLGMTTVLVTHDQAEAMAISDRVAVMSGGRIDASTTPALLYAQPPSLFSARFIGSPQINVWPVDGPDGALAKRIAPSVRDGMVVGLRPEHVVVGSGDIVATVRLSEQLGRDVLLHLAVGESLMQALVPSGADVSLDPGSEVRVGADAVNLHFFDAATGARIEASTRGPATIIETQEARPGGLES